MRKQQSGFTLIELVMVIVILGILAVTAIPKFTDLSAEANQAAIDGIAGAIGSASAINYAVRSANAAKGTAIASATACADVGALLEGGSPVGVTYTEGAVTGSTKACTATKNAVSSTYTAHIIP